MVFQRKGEGRNPSDTSTVKLLRSYKEKEQQVTQQKALKAQYDIEDEDVLVVEKKNAIAQILRAIFHAVFTILRIIANILLVILAVIGLAAIIYPNIRVEVINTAKIIVDEVVLYLNV